MKKCAYCGRENPDEAQACAECATTEFKNPKEVWYYVEKGQKVGPVPEDEIKVRLEARAINGQSLVWHEGAPDWKPLSTFPQFSALVPASDSTRIQPVTQLHQLTMNELRDRNETTALVWLYVCAAPVLLFIAGWCVVSLGLGLIVVGLVWLLRWMAEFFSAAYIKTNGIRVSENQLPDVHRVVTHCCQRLSVEPPEVFILQHSIWNAFAAKLASQRLIVLYSGAIDSILLKGDMTQLTWLVGHEVGHHVAGHLDWTHTLARFGTWAPWIFLWYSRRAEFTCDRVALYCVGKLQPSLLALANATVGAQLAEKVNIAAAVQDWENYRREFFVKYRTIYSTHPPHLWRMQQLCNAAAEFGIY